MHDHVMARVASYDLQPLVKPPVSALRTIYMNACEAGARRRPSARTRAPGEGTYGGSIYWPAGIKTWLAAATLLLAGCASPPAADCAWAREIIPAPEDQLARNTALQIVAHNRKVREFCR